jgi:hypothetical protein
VITHDVSDEFELDQTETSPAAKTPSRS